VRNLSVQLIQQERSCVVLRVIADAAVRTNVDVFASQVGCGRERIVMKPTA
jgi:hypothetical protein